MPRLKSLSAMNLKQVFAYRVPREGDGETTGFNEGGGTVVTVEKNGKVYVHLLMESSRNSRKILHYATSLPGKSLDDTLVNELPTLYPQAPGTENKGVHPVHGLSIYTIFGDVDASRDLETTVKGVGVHPDTGDRILLQPVTTTAPVVTHSTGCQSMTAMASR